MFNPAKASANIKDEFIDYISTEHFFSDSNLQSQLKKELSKEISKGPFVEINDVFSNGGSIEDLIAEGILSPLFADIESGKPDTKLYKRILPLSRKLYRHQENAIRKIVAGNNTVISTGTGSGKTNCFLIPVLNDLLREKEKGTLSSGVRALFIYPMNALANDQMKNIRNLLLFYPDITFGVYNGATEYEERDAIAVYEAMFGNEKTSELRHRLPNEILSRDEMKKTPPNILFTNYAMLEHLLLRPNDDVLFSRADFKYVVLDEAHIYTGATGIETSLLLRRLRARISASRETQFILTSATLGSDSRSDDDIVRFAENLCGVSFTKKSIIRSQREAYISAPSLVHYNNDLYNRLADEQNIVWEVLSAYGIECDKSAPEGELLYDFIRRTDLYELMRNKAHRITNITELQHILGVDTSTAVSFISLCTRAQKNGKALLDARYHFFIRSLEGCYIAFSPKQKVFLNRQKHYYEDNEEYAVFEVTTCNECGKIAIVGKEENRHLVQINRLEEEAEYYYLYSERNDDIEEDDDNDDEYSKSNNEKNNKDYVYYLCKKCGALIPEDELHDPACDCGKEYFIKIVHARKLKNGARCGNCKHGVYKRFYLGNDAATAVLATSLYEELPEIEYEEEYTETSTTNIFATAVQKTKKQSRRTGRQFLAFSDSRQEAAKFACYLSKSYDEFLRRRGICQIIQERKNELIATEHTISDFVILLTSFFASKKAFSKSNSDESNLTVSSRKNAWVAVLNELARYSSPTSLTSLGQIQFEYKGNSKEICQAIADNYQVSVDLAKNLIDLLVFEIVKRGAITTDSASDIDDNDREFIFYTSSQRFITYLQAPEKKRKTVSDWAPHTKKGKTDEWIKTNRLDFVCKMLNVSEKDGVDFLRQYYEYLVNPEYGNKYCMEDINKDGTYAMPARYFTVKVPGSPDAHWYRCKKCGKVSSLNFGGKCVAVKCGGDQEEIDPSSIGESNHFAKLYLGKRMSPLFIKEHTAQLSKKESAEYQEQFIKKDINALSCSTTFEMGVDVGDLETVFLRDVPPLPSNYAQRAGRAGRSVNAAAYALTFAKLSSHDLSFFKEPDRMIGGTILPPLFKVDNEKIVRRHIYAVALSMFFSEHEEQYNHNDARVFINEKGYELFVQWIESHPDRLKRMLIRSIPDIDGLHDRIGINDFSWTESFWGDDGVFSQLIKEYESNVANFKSLIAKYKKEDLSKASSCERRLRIYTDNRLIDFLARGNILPRYGFPVDTVELHQNTTANNISRLRLSRDLQIAIAEYAPSSEVVADGRLYTSRYILKSVVGNGKQDWHTAYIGTCSNDLCKTINYSILPITAEGVWCASCGKKLTKLDFHESIEPRSGFMTERQDKDVPMTRQEKNYRSDDYYIGNKAAKTIDKYAFTFNGIKIIVESTTNDSLLVKSSNSFYVCPKCGYSVAEDETIGDKDAEKAMKMHYPKITTAKAHESIYGQYNCDCKDLNRRSLHHVFNTDVAKISFDCDTSDYKKMISVMYALLNAVSQKLNIERRDIKGCLDYKLIDSRIDRSIIIYDSVPGGAGHSRRLLTNDGMLLHSVFMLALRNMTECNCDPSCYNCLRSYDNQKMHDLLDRNLAADFLKQFDGSVSVVSI